MKDGEEFRPTRKTRWFRVVGLIAAVALLGAGGKVMLEAKARGPVAKPASPTAIPVTATKVSTRDLPIERSGLGTVTSLNAIDVKFRADGQLQSIGFTEGRDVNAGDVLAQIDRRPYEAQLAQAQAAYQKDQASLDNAKADEARAGKLNSSGAGTTQAIDTAKAQVAVFTAALAGDQAAIDTAKLNLEFTTVRAPISGRVGLRQIDEGAIVHASDSTGVVSITQMAPISVRFSLPQDDLPALIAGQGQANLSVTVYSRDGARHLADGKLAVIDSQVDTSTGMIRLKAVFPNDDKALWPGELVTARILISVDRNATVVPDAAVQNGQNGSYVFIVKPDRTVAATPVTTGPTVGGYTALLSGVSPGQDIVLGGQSRLTDGSLVAPKMQATDNNQKPGPPT